MTGGISGWIRSVRRRRQGLRLWSRNDAICGLWSLLLAALLVGPGLAPGYLLVLDMVWVPDLALRSDFLGLASGLPRAVPSDAVVAVLDEVIPGQVLQKVALVGALVGGGLGASRLGPDALPMRLLALGFFQWNALVFERFLLGHWPVLIGYAVLPWLVVLARSWRSVGSLPWPLLVLLPLGSLSASAGLATAFTLLATAGERRRWKLLIVLVAASNAPWVIAGLLHAGAATTDPLGARVFALADEGAVPGPLAALTLGGAWNSEVVPGSRSGSFGWIVLVIIVGLVALGARRWWSSTHPRERAGLVACWAVGWLLAVGTWAVPGAVGWLAANVPGMGLVRDGARVLVLCSPLLVSMLAWGAAEVWRSVGGTSPARWGLATAMTLLPLALLPEAAWGLGGALRPAAYPASYAEARRVLADEAERGLAGDVLVLPLSSYRRPPWNNGQKVLDPLGRYLDRNYVASDVLSVSGTALAGEDPRVRAAVDALAAEQGAERAERLAQLGIGVVVVDLAAPGGEKVPAVDGRRILQTPEMAVVAIEEPRTVSPGGAAWVATVVGWLAFVGTLLAGVALGLARILRIT